jgi:hypothetical protein
MRFDRATQCILKSTISRSPKTTEIARSFFMARAVHLKVHWRREKAMKTKPTVSFPMRHSFAIKVLERLPGFFQPHRYIYYCSRCKWSFVVNDGKRGVISALGADNQRLETDEEERRLATFAYGPCPSLRRLMLASITNGHSNGIAIQERPPRPFELTGIGTTTRT